MNQSVKQKILVCGNVKGKFRQLFNRVETVNKKSGPFDLLLCVGDFFGETNDELEDYKNGSKSIAVPTYILGPNSEEQLCHYSNIEGSEICTNLTYLGKRGLYTDASKLRIAYVSGIEAPNVGEKREWHFTKEDIQAVRNSCLANKSTSTDFRGVDILLTSQWPFAIRSDGDNSSSSKYLSWLAVQVKPRYHFVGLCNENFEPDPYRTPPDDVSNLQLATRFISLAEVGNPNKTKYLYALGIEPCEKVRLIELVQKSTNEVPCPYVGLNLGMSPVKARHDGHSQYFFDMNNQTGGGHKRHHPDRGGPHNKRPAFDTDKCWFCLSSANVEKHLVITVGKHFYTALPKGPINDYHVLILSVHHIQSAALLTTEAWEELAKLKNAFKAMCGSKEKVVTFFERNYKTAHLQINVVGVDKTVEWKIRDAFNDKNEEYNLELMELPPINNPADLPSQGPYFVAELPNNDVLLTKNMKNFPIHFGREVFCYKELLNCEEKINWKECLLEKDMEVQRVKQIREEFKPFNK